MKEKEILEFYKHPKMKDGHLGKCKECTKLDSRINSRTEYSRLREKIRNTKKDRIKKITETTRKWRINNPEKYRAQNTVNNALRDGKIQKPKNCEFCGRNKKLHAHHEDYSKPLDVNWICVLCHGEKNPNYIGIN